MKGFSSSQEQIHCRALRSALPVPFPVSECRSYDDKRLPSRWDMENIAWILLTKKAGRSIGFVTAKQFREIAGPDADLIPAASDERKASD